MGEAPGRTEDENNSPFVGDAGKLLREVLEQVIGPDYEQHVAFTNSVRCFPHTMERSKWGRIYKAGRTPTEEEIQHCSYYLAYDLEQLQPELILALGNVPLYSLFGEDTGITQARGKVRTLFHRGRQIPVLPTLHPSYILRRKRVDIGILKGDIEKAWALVNGRKPYEPDWETVTDPARLTQLVDETIAQYQSGALRYFAFDYETAAKKAPNALRPYRKDFFVIGASFANDSSKGYFVPLRHSELPESYPELQMRGLLAKLYTTVPSTIQNSKFDTKVAEAAWGVKPKAVVFDTMVASYLRYHEIYMTHGLKDLVQIHLGMEDYSRELDEFLAQFKKSDRTYDRVPLQMLSKYACYDAACTFRLTEVLEPEIDEWGLREPMETLIRASYRFGVIEQRGVRVDRDFVEKTRVEYETESEHQLELMRAHPQVAKLEEEIGQQFNPRSPKMAPPLVFDPVYFGAPMLEDWTTDKGAPSIKEAAVLGLMEWLETKLGNVVRHETDPKWSSLYAFLQEFRTWKKLQKILTSYVYNIKDNVHEDEEGHWIYHPDFNLTKVRGGRLSSGFHTLPGNSSPRRWHISRWHENGGLVLNTDYSQMEVRVLAALSGDEGLLQAFSEDQDIHLYIASRVFKKPEDLITKEERKSSKTVTFGILYGESEESVAASTGLTLQEAKNLVRDFFQEFPRIRDLVEAAHKSAHDNLFVRTAYNRVRHIVNANSSKESERREAERQSFNAIIQSPASDITLRAILEIEDELERRGLHSYVWASVHDSILTDVYPGELFQVWSIVKDTMEHKVPEATTWCKAKIKSSYAIEPRWDGGMEVKAIAPKAVEDNDAMIQVKAPIQFLEETLVQLRKNHDIGFHIIKYESREEERMLRRAYTGSAGGSVTVNAEVVFHNMQGAAAP